MSPELSSNYFTYMYKYLESKFHIYHIIWPHAAYQTTSEMSLTHIMQVHQTHISTPSCISTTRPAPAELPHAMQAGCAQETKHALKDREGV